jgi:plastocyanin
VTITAQQYFPGGLGLSGALGPPAVEQGKKLQFVNTDFFAADIRHTVTSCAAPCDGSYWANYPLPDGTFDSGFLGWEPTTGGGGPEWTLDTSQLGVGRYTYFCRIHPWMRGAFDVV